MSKVDRPKKNTGKECHLFVTSTYIIYWDAFQISLRSNESRPYLLFSSIYLVILSPSRKSSVDSTTQYGLCHTVISTIPPKHLRINAHRHLFYKIRILVFTNDEYNIHGVIFSWVRRNSGVNICHSSSFTIFRFFRGGKPFQCHKLPTLHRQNSGLSRGVKLLLSPFCPFRLTSLFSQQHIMNMSCIFFLYSFSKRFQRFINGNIYYFLLFFFSFLVRF